MFRRCGVEKTFASKTIFCSQCGLGFDLRACGQIVTIQVFAISMRCGTGFSLAEADIVLDEARESAPDGADASIEDNIPAYRHEGPTVTQPGDLWMLGRHKLVCGDAREAGAYAALLGDEVVDLICTDPPYNVPIDGHVCGSGRIRHRNFAMGVGEMNKDQFTRFLVDSGTSSGALPGWRDRICLHG
jgi:hypothetical protein